MRTLLARRVVAAIDLATGSISADLVKVDDIAHRAMLAGSPDATKHFVSHVMRIYEQELRGELKRTVGRRTGPAIRTYLETVLPPFQTSVLASTAVHIASIELWGEAADQFAATAHASASVGHPEYRVLDALLFASYFRSCRLTSVSDVHGALEPLAHHRLFARGSLTRIVQSCTNEVVLDPDPPAPRGTLGATAPSLRLSESLLPVVAAELSAILGGAGVMRRLISPQAPRDGLPPSAVLVAARNEVYLQYEFSTLAHMALAAVEQSLRALAEHHGIVHLKTNGAPHGVMHWVAQLPSLLPETQSLIAALYDSRRGGLRNRVAHGSLIDVASKRYERVLVASGQASRVAVGSDPYLPESVATVCVEALEAVGRDLVSASVSSAAFRWMAQLAPTPVDVEFASSLRTGLVSPDPRGWIQQITGFLRVFCPTAGRFFSVGLTRWINSQLPTTHAELTYLVLTFEAVVRTVAQVMRQPCLGTAIVGNELRTQYLMLDEAGLNDARFVDRVVGVVPTSSGQSHARRCLQLATTTRNACVHGALGAASPDDIRALSKSIVLAVDLFVTRALHHMCEEAAYFVWERESQAGRWIDREAAWQEGERNVLSQIAAEAEMRLT